jgi:hypothetical protein
MYSIRLLDLISIQHQLYDTNFVPNSSNYMAECKYYHGQFTGEIIETYKKFNVSRLLLSDHLKLKNVNKDCLVKMTVQQYNKMTNELKTE